jgi:hypothetical protein
MNKSDLVFNMKRELMFNFDEYDDGCGGISHTLLAQYIAEEHDLYVVGNKIPGYVYAAAKEVSSTWHQRKAS